MASVNKRPRIDVDGGGGGAAAAAPPPPPPAPTEGVATVNPYTGECAQAVFELLPWVCVTRVHSLQLGTWVWVVGQRTSHSHVHIIIKENN